MPDNKIQIGISSCLLGHKVRYDGGHKYNNIIATSLGNYFEFIPFCPEVEIGMGIPRDPIQLEWINGEVRCVDVNNKHKDMTDKLVECANQQQHWQKEICGYILKKNSPSCGLKHVKLFKHGIAEPVGTGIYAGQLIKNFPELPVIEEDEIENIKLRESFIEQVKAYKSFSELRKEKTETSEP